MRHMTSLIALLIFISCKGGGGGGGGSSAQPVVVNYGVYQRCENFAADDASVKRDLILHESGLMENVTYFDHLNCSAGNESWAIRYLYSYSGTNGTYRLTAEGMTTTSLSNADLTYNNNNSYCGFNNWVLNVPKNTLGRNCEGDILNQGDYLDVTVAKQGNDLLISSGSSSVLYTFVGGWDFSAHGQTVANGSYAFYDGSIGAYFTAAGGNYSVVYYDPATLRYFTETGTYTSSNNTATFIATNYTPDCGDDEGQADTYPISTTSFTLSIQFPEAALMMEKVPYTSAEFQSAYLGGGYAAGCF